ncbi:hypothetical protein GQ43DRAFT_436109 [Delitschia confertaspora ATCC 74209]|uniref:Major facilitator superfamily (MFS) profile domain-containing protein n=1 Tax=Delitschia confertaspora ATCC 74209 TaxID=1513339 RepID=A0A9P4MQU1_9PLEO|nr:hypothetical protein GQ43DRAFT_436109 [Delitschia confertaspora ATCC 74209]
MCLSPVGAMLGGVTASKNIPSEYILALSATVISIGIGLLGSTSVNSPINPAIYGYEIITGLGLGLSGPSSYVLLGTMVEEKDLATGTGTLNVLRTLGGSIGVIGVAISPC